MSLRSTCRWLVLLVIVCVSSEAVSAVEPGRWSDRRGILTAAAANDPASMPRLSRGAAGPAVLRAQILLDRAHFSPGEIDGRYGFNTALAAFAFNAVAGTRGGEDITAETWRRLNLDATDVIVPYVVAPEDVAGPFAPIPEDIMEKAKLDVLPYESAIERLGEKFHSSPDLLDAMNPGITFEKAGVEVQVPNVDRAKLAAAATIRVSESERSVVALDRDGRVMAHYPATIGSELDPLPIGEWKVTYISRKPRFSYDPDLFWDAPPTDQRATLPPGPNNPVGVVWIDLSKQHYGIHGTSEPSTIGKTTSHGCIRMTNWDALELSNLIAAGTPVILQK